MDLDKPIVNKRIFDRDNIEICYTVPFLATIVFRRAGRAPTAAMQVEEIAKQRPHPETAEAL